MAAEGSAQHANITHHIDIPLLIRARLDNNISHIAIVMWTAAKGKNVPLSNSNTRNTRTTY
jgi:hypothetical protein